MLHDGSHRVLEDLEDNVIQMRWHIHNANRCSRMQIVVLDKLQFRTSHIVLIAQKPSVLKCILDDGTQVAHGVNAADVASLARYLTEKNC